MKKIFFKTTIVLMFLVIAPGLSLARQGHGSVYDVFAGEKFTYTGVVKSIIPGHGIEIDTGEDLVTVYGIGPKRYWNSLEVERPEVGDDVSVEGYTVKPFGHDRNIAVIITIAIEYGEVDVELRDSETGIPLWYKD